MVILDKIFAFGHDKLLCTHNTTIEISKDNFLTPKGNCILGINSSKACNTLDENLKLKIHQGKKLKVVINVDKYSDEFYGFGNNKLTLSSEKDMIFRKSDFICDRTVLINCTKSSIELDRDLINSLKVLGKKFEILFETADPNE